MLKFIARRLGSSVLVLFLASILVYFLVTISGDPLQDLRESSDKNRETLMRQRSEYMNLDLPWFVRYLAWLRGVGGCVIGKCDLGRDRQGMDVLSQLGLAANSTLRLVLLSVILAAVVGIAIGLLTAIRQYTDLDYIVTFVSFIFFSLPSFWAAVLLKEYGAINFNNWISNPQFTPMQVVGTAIVLGFILQLFMGGSWKRRLLTFGITAVVVGAALPYFTWLRFWQYPQMGPAVIVIVAAAVAAFCISTTTGFKEMKVVIPAAISVVLVAVAYYATFWMLQTPNWWILAIGLVLAVAIPWAIGAFMGGRYKTQAISAAVITAVVGAGLTIVDHLFRAWPGFLSLKPRPISTIGSETPNFAGGFWETFLDRGSQLLLPTLLLALISIASYSRYTRAAMLDVNGQDYMRTARSKGLPERVVILRHAFRNAMIPLVTIVAMDFAGLIGGAVITEQVFGWQGMGAMFQTGLQQVDPNPVMAFVVVTGGVAVLFNLLTDVIYGLIDPRIRL